MGSLAPLNGRSNQVVPAVAREASTLLRLRGDQFERLLRNAPGLRKHVEDALARQGRRLKLRDANA